MSEDTKETLWGVAPMVVFTVGAFLCLALLSGCAVASRNAATVSTSTAVTRRAITQAAALAPAPPAIRLQWSKPAEIPPIHYTEVWATTNFATWYLKTNVAGNVLTLPATQLGEFYKIRLGYSVGNLLLFTDWARKQ